MQTFLSELTFADSVVVLDSVRLQKQYLEGWQILNAISLTPAGPRTVKIDGKYPYQSNHPATNMWRGYEPVLYNDYLARVKIELDSRGIKTDILTKKLADTFNENAGAWLKVADHQDIPDWWTDHDQRVKIINSHRASLYNKDNIYYAQYKASASIFALALAEMPYDVVCCPGKHANYWYPTHRS